jgi:putative endonuclease
MDRIKRPNLINHNIIIYSENFETRLEARNREKYFKSGIGKEKLKIIRENQGQ